jgi:hypothetical protein
LDVWDNSVKKLIEVFGKDRKKLATDEVYSQSIVICIEGGMERVLANWKYLLHVGNAVFENKGLAIIWH